MRRAVGLWGLAAAAAYLAAAALSFGAGLVPVRPIYDGLAPPPPYNYVDPPPELAEDNRPPQPGEGTVEFTPEGSMARSVATPDGQALLILPQGAIEPREGERLVEVTLEPLSPASMPAPPAGLVIDGNAYAYEAVYRPSGEEAVAARELTVVLRYAVHAEQLLMLDGGAWRPLEADAAPGSLQLFGDTDRLGVFAAAGPPVEEGRDWTPVAIAGLGVLAAVVGYLVGRRPRSGAKPETRADRRRQQRRRS